MPCIHEALQDAISRLTPVSESAVLDAEVLLALSLAKPRSHLRAWPEKRLAEQQLECFEQLLEQRRQGVPIAYLTGQKEFWSRAFKVTTDVLIPRPDTELLIEISLGLINQHKLKTVLDLGTGSGIIAVTLAAECPFLQVTAVDASRTALEIAKHNAKIHQTTEISFIESDWFSNLGQTKFELIVGNPPYIPEHDPHLQQGDLRFEPRHALIAAQNGLSDIEKIAAEARRHFNDSGHLLLEHGYNQAPEVQAIFKQLGYAQVETYSDLAGNPRATYGQWRATFSF